MVAGVVDNLGNDEGENSQDIEDNDLYIGQKFDTLDELYAAYKSYGQRLGFVVRKLSQRKNGDGIVRSVSYCCNREGEPTNASQDPTKPQKTYRMGCKAKVTARLYIDDKWEITTLVLDHNHEVSPSISRLYRCNRKVSAHVKHRLDLNDQPGIRMHKNYMSVVNEADGYDNITCTEKDVKRSHTRVKVSFSCWKNNEASIRYNQMCMKFNEVADLASENDEQYKVVNDWLDDKVKELIAKSKELGKVKVGKEVQEIEQLETHEEVQEAELAPTVRDPTEKKRKGRPRSTRIQATRKRTYTKKKPLIENCQAIINTDTPNFISNGTAMTQETLATTRTPPHDTYMSTPSCTYMSGSLGTYMSNPNTNTVNPSGSVSTQSISLLEQLLNPRIQPGELNME